MARKQLVLLLCVQAIAGVLGQGSVYWEMGMIGVSEGNASVEVCAVYFDAVDGFTIEISTTNDSAIEGEDYLALEGTAAQLVWTADNPRVCTKIPLVDDRKVENDEYFFVTMDRIVTPSASPILDRRPLIVLIMDNDIIQLVFTSGNITVTDDIGTVDACVGVAAELSDDQVSYRIPIVVETIGITAEPDVDFISLNNMTAKTGNTAVLTPSSPEHCFTVTVLQQPDEFDDRSFAFSVMLREGAAVEPSRNLIHLPTTDLEVTVQPSAIIEVEVGDIVDTVISNPLYSVSLDIEGDESDSNLCYEVHGSSGTVFNLVSDKCFSINARYNEINGTSGRYNEIDDLTIRASDAAENCVDIVIYSEDVCKLAFVRTGTSFEEISTQFQQKGIRVDFIKEHIEVVLPCRSYPGGGIRVIVTCFSEFENPISGEILSVRSLGLEFNRAKLPGLTDPLPHGLLGQFWHRNFTRERFTGSAALPDNAYQVTTPTELGSGSFISVFYHLTWDLRDEGCLYAGTRQAGATRYVSSPADSVIEGEYTNYKVLHHFGTEYEFSVFSYEDYGCPAFPGIPIRSSE